MELDSESKMSEHIAETKASRQVMIAHVEHLKEAILNLSDASRKVNDTLQIMPSMLAKELAVIIKEQGTLHSEQIKRFEEERERMFHNLHQELMNHDMRMLETQELISKTMNDNTAEIKTTFLNERTWRSVIFNFIRETAAIVAALLAVLTFIKVVWLQKPDVNPPKEKEQVQTVPLKPHQTFKIVPLDPDEEIPPPKKSK